MPLRSPLHGVEPSQEHRKEEILRDIRPLADRIPAALLRREGFALTGLAVMVLLVWTPASLPLLLPLYLVLSLVRALCCRSARLPMRLPLSWGREDPADLAPDGSPRTARGSFYLGNALDDGRELWLAREDALTHTLLLGTTGSGKTETLVSLAVNYLAQGSGLLYTDPKAAPRLAAQIWTLCRMLGRDDDFLLLSFMADRQAQEGGRGPARSHTRRSNTQNPFSVGSASALAQLLFALMPEESGSNAIFSSNAQSLIAGLLFALVELRDRGEVSLSTGLIRRCLMSLPEIDALARRGDLSEKAVLALRAGLSTVGWDSSRPLDQQPRNFAEQYGYARAYFGRALSLLVDLYGKIFLTDHGEIDAVDVITSRRVCLTLIPSMDKDPKELRQLGQICLSSIRSACAVGLGDRVQGRLADVLGSLPTDARSPFGIIVDEYAAIECPGFEILLTQGRGLGIAVTLASQDFAGLRRSSEHAAEQIVSNTKLKGFMCTEDPRQTMDLVRALAGEAWVQKSTGWSVRGSDALPGFADNLAVGMDRLPRADFRDLQKQTEGQATLFFRGEMIRARCFYASPPLAPDQEIRLAVQLRVQAPDIRRLACETRLARALEGFFRALAAGSAPPDADAPPFPPALAGFARHLAQPGIRRERRAVRRCAAALLLSGDPDAAADGSGLLFETDLLGEGPDEGGTGFSARQED